MSISTTRFAPPHVGTAGDQRPHFAACTDAQVGGLLWRGQFAHRPIHPHDVSDFQRHHLPAFPEAIAASPNARPAHDPRARQHPLTSRRPPGFPSASLQAKLETLMPTTLQSATRTHRAGLETDPAPGYTQPLLGHAPRGLAGHQRVLRSLASSEYNTVAPMLHYLRRCV